MDINAVITEVQKFTLKPGDILVLQVESPLNKTQVEGMHTILEEMCPVGVKFMVLDKLCRVTVVEAPMSNITKLEYPKNTTSIDDMCKILDFFGFEPEEYTDCTIMYKVTFDQIRAVYNLGKDFSEKPNGATRVESTDTSDGKSVESIEDIAAEMISLSIKAGRRASYDLLHACDDIWSEETSNMYRQRARMWLDIFATDNGMKDYRHTLHKDIDSLEMKVNKLLGILKKNGIDPEDELPF